MDKDPPQAMSLFSDGFAIQYRQRIIDFGVERRAPVISGWQVFAKSGAICTYGPKLSESYRRLAYYVDRILKGVPTSELPIERPTKFDRGQHTDREKARIDRSEFYARLRR